MSQSWTPFVSWCQIRNPIVQFEGVEWESQNGEARKTWEEQQRNWGQGRPPTSDHADYWLLISFPKQNWHLDAHRNKCHLWLQGMPDYSKLLHCWLPRLSCIKLTGHELTSQTSELYQREWQFTHQVEFWEWFVSSVSQFIYLWGISIYYYLHSSLPHSHYNLTGT